MRYAVVPTEGDYEAIALPSPLTFGYYAVRPLRLVGKYGRERSATFGSHVRGFFSDARNSVGVSRRSP